MTPTLQVKVCWLSGKALCVCLRADHQVHLEVTCWGLDSEGSCVESHVRHVPGVGTWVND